MENNKILTLGEAEISILNSALVLVEEIKENIEERFYSPLTSSIEHLYDNVNEISLCIRELLGNTKENRNEKQFFSQRQTPPAQDFDFLNDIAKLFEGVLRD